MTSLSARSVKDVAFASDKKDKILVAALDIGASSSGYAFSFKSDFKADPSKVTTNKNWIAGSFSSLKTPTCVLFNEKQEFHSFGFDAENDFAELALDDEHKKCYFFKRFKMILYGKKIDHDIEVEDIKGKTMAAKKVFGEVIRYLKNHLLKLLKARGTGVENKDIHWVLTVPAIWSDSAKQFMREAAYVAEIDGGQLTIALEPEAASLYCQACQQMSDSDSAKFEVLSPGSKYMVIDLEDDTADITVHERQDDGTLRELHKPDGGPCGWVKVDEEFTSLLIKIVGVPTFKAFQDKNLSDLLDLQRELEIKKRTVTNDTSGKITMRVPTSIADEYEEKTYETIDDAIDESPFKGKLTWRRGKLRIEAELFRSIFKGCIDKITRKVLDLLKDPKVKGTNLFLVVGSFSECSLVQDALREALPKGKIIIPEEAGLAVLKGAVIFGHTCSN